MKPDAYTPFPTHLLPPVPRAYVDATAAAMNCDPAYSALPTLAALGAAIGSSHVASPKRGWKEPPYIWALPIGRSGAVKSPPYRDVEDMAEDINDRLETEFEVAKLEHETALEQWLAASRDAKNGGPDPGPRPAVPVKKSFIKGDVTIEALVGTLQDNPRGLFIGQDELSAWIGGFVKYSGKTGASDLPRWLQLSNAGSINYTRKTGDRREVRIRGVGVSVAGTIQPTILARVLNEDFKASGFLARLLLAMPPWRKRLWTEAEVDEDTHQALSDLLNALFALPQGTYPGSARPAPHLVRLSDDAKKMFIAFYDANGTAMETADEDMSAVMSKLEGYALRFALIFHCCRLKEYAKDDRIAGADMEAAITLTRCPFRKSLGSRTSCLPKSLRHEGTGKAAQGLMKWTSRWFRDETERVYMALGESPDMQVARQLYEVVRKLAERHGGRVTPRQLQRSNWKKYPDASSAEAALESLVAAGLGTWVEITSGPKGGRPTRAFVPSRGVDTTDTTSTPPDDGEPEDGSGSGSSVTQPPWCDTTPSQGVDSRFGVNPERSGGCTNSARTSKTPSEVVSVVSHPRKAPDPHPIQTPHKGVGLCHTEGVVSHDSPILITNADDVEQVVSALENCTGPVGLDTETTGMNHSTDLVRVLSIAIPSGTFLLDLFAIADPPTSLALVFDALSTVEIVGHNLGFDLPFLMRLGFIPGRVRDTMLASQVLQAGRDYSVGHALKDLAERHLGLTLDKELQKASWLGPITPEQGEYAAKDAELPVRLWGVVGSELATTGLTGVVADESAALPCVAWAARMGVGFDRQSWEKLAGEAEAKRDRLREELDTHAPNPGTLFRTRNWDSPAEVKTAFAALGIALESTDDDALAGVDQPLAGVVREYRSVGRLATTYGRDWLRHVAPDGRVYATWKQIGAGASGRMSCKEPNLQQLPRDVRYRRCFVAPSGRVLVKADYSQIELRIAAKVSGDRRMLDAYRRGEDLHTLTARALLGKIEVTKADRQLAKAVNFGLLYGQGAEGLRRYALGSYGVALTPEEATAHRETFFRTYPGLRSWHWKIGKPPVDTRTLAGRRRLHVTRFNEKLNTPVQGTGADGLKRALGLLWQRRSTCPDAFPVLFVHDEIVVECPISQQEEAAAWVRDAMRDGMAPLIDPIPVEVEVSAGSTWGG